MAADVLVVDDEADIRELVAGILADEGYAVRTADDSESALAEIRARKPALLILDIWMQGGGMDGLELLDMVKGLDADLPVIMISGHGNIETAVSAIKRGAYEFLEKPFKSDRLLLVVERALEAANLRRENRRLRARAVTPDGLIGRSAAVQQLRGLINKLAAANSRVLISGPPGAGKETVARMIHAASPRARSEFLVISAAGMTPERVDIELFGEEGEAGRPAKIGVFERAHGGTLYLDEVADMPRETQSRILRVLVDQRFRRVGGVTDVQVDVRVVSSTCLDLRVEIAEGRFREDLFHRLNVVPLGVPGLAERREDIPELVDFFVQRISEGAGLARRRLSDDAVAALQVRTWPGNLSQLRNQIERLLILASGDPAEPITAEMIPPEPETRERATSGLGAERMIALPLREAREVFERDYLHAQMLRFSGNISRTAAFIGMERSALHRKLKSLGLSGAKMIPEGEEG
ncbi:sigma-54 dependent transcriptional regulator [Phenylobacterium sp.]|jgi:two-component system nitrogen regulation response regulator NtrX|uniref:nitrogen assimilation response regulator NtrX n=1 Tax=Phenylobacterium sp. TaxID=1871053 RepID=UPI0025D9465B|nr:sigma-54 dependent transcriptional regulator [Phenylobacterium sp.]MCA6286978.1 sigma-54-dependent Fis family transcriptional regulator [Phenylobacterium sp.]MCA6309897.1 sigma-54-dependent Fis family transcriptional regulator [Phenylobacterium sp.]MCA6322621.1 sigma-54-dependent Fis family transcriptional regulator [Phenylobacterium sp.]MCA6335993.1 sigma-54-dependent Fis family transcriptional regulator [Phenylobacterium sp.]MCA6338738.1 sigma-54-dependent Fis family transcriptional regul